MKQPKSLSTLKPKTIKRPLFPSFRHSKQINKLQELILTGKNQLFLHVKILPLELFIANQNKDQIKLIITSDDVTLFMNGRNVRKQIKTLGHSWICVDLIASSEVKVKKVGDENVFNKAMLVWGREGMKEKVTDIFPVSIEKMIGLEMDRKLDNPTQPNQKMKKYVATIMNKKHKSINEVGIHKIMGKKNSTLMKNKLPSYNNTMQASTLLYPPGTAISTGSEIRSFRNNLKESKFGKSEKETSIGGDYSVANFKKTIHLNPFINDEDYMKKKMRFDSQPYFQQTSENSKLNDTRISQENKSILGNKTIHKSEEEVQIQEQIGRSQFRQQKNDEFEKAIEKEEESALCESQHISSSGTLYQSRYQ